MRLLSFTIKNGMMPMMLPSGAATHCLRFQLSRILQQLVDKPVQQPITPWHVWAEKKLGPRWQLAYTGQCHLCTPG